MRLDEELSSNESQPIQPGGVCEDRTTYKFVKQLVQKNLCKCISMSESKSFTSAESVEKSNYICHLRNSNDEIE